MEQALPPDRNLQFVVQVASEIGAGSWSALPVDLALTNGLLQLVETFSTNTTKRFCRVIAR
jgi:hypothetical protein